MSLEYFHGGQRGLLIGGRILPRSQTGAKNTLGGTADKYHVKGREIIRPGRVYVVVQYDAALMYAAVHPSVGQVYRVRPIGQLMPDPDCSQFGLSWECEAAEILDVMEPTRDERIAVLRVFGIDNPPRRLLVPS